MPQSHGNFCQVKAGNKSDLIKLRKEIYPKQFMYGTKFLDQNSLTKDQISWVGNEWGKEMVQDAAKRHGEFCFICFSEL
jgi:hypothetical protein